MADGDKPPGGGGGPKKPQASSTIIGLTPPKEPAPPAPAPAPAPPPPAAAPPPGSPSTKRMGLPPPTRGPHAPPTRPSGPTPGQGYQPPAQPAAPQQPPHAQPHSAAPPAQPHSAPHAAPHAQPHSAPHAAPIVEQPSGPTQPFGAATGPHAHPGSHAQPASYAPPTTHAPAAVPIAPQPAPMAPPVSAPPASFDAYGGAPSFGQYQQPSSASYGGGDLPPGASFDSIEAPGSKFVAFLKISARRAFRLRIEPSEVLPSERTTLENSYPPIVDRNLQAFLAWRRSVLFLVASALIPLTIIGVIDALQSRKFTPIFFVRGAPALAEGIFAWVCWSQLKKWSSWRQQRRKLFYGWLIFMLMPFVVFLYPLRTIFEDLGGSSREKLLALGVEGAYRQAVMPFVFAMLAMLQLAPKAISLMPFSTLASMPCLKRRLA